MFYEQSTPVDRTKLTTLMTVEPVAGEQGGRQIASTLFVLRNGPVL